MIGAPSLADMQAVYDRYRRRLAEWLGEDDRDGSSQSQQLPLGQTGGKHEGQSTP